MKTEDLKSDDKSGNKDGDCFNDAQSMIDTTEDDNFFTPAPSQIKENVLCTEIEGNTLFLKQPMNKLSAPSQVK